MMRSIFYLVILISFYSCKENQTSLGGSTSAEDTTRMTVPREDSLETVQELTNLEDIRIEHAYITHIIEKGKMNVSTFSYNCKEEKKGKVTYFYEETRLRLIRHTYNEYSHFSATDEYFIKDGKPFFVFYNHLAWSFTGQNQTQDKITEKRFYVLNNKAVQCLGKNYTITSDEKESTDPNTVPHEEIECPIIESILEDFELLYKMREQEKDLNCLDD